MSLFACMDFQCHFYYVLENGQYRMVGGAYIRGMDNWKVVNDLVDRGELKEVTFQIR